MLGKNLKLKYYNKISLASVLDTGYKSIQVMNFSATFDAKGDTENMVIFLKMEVLAPCNSASSFDM